MKHLLSLLLFLTSFFTLSQVSPGSDCLSAGCSISGSYTNIVNTPSMMGTWGCLWSTPNPNWLSIGIATSGNIHLVLTQTNTSGTLIDVDFAVYGPYNTFSYI